MRHLRTRQDRGVKLNGEKSLDLCTGCYSFHCDPMSMSPAFQAKIHDRLRQGRCPACGKPKGFCSCKSVLAGHGEVKKVMTHNNKKLRKAERDIALRERAFRIWSRLGDRIVGLIGDEAYGDIYVALKNHERPELDWPCIASAVSSLCIDVQALAYAWK